MNSEVPSPVLTATGAFKSQERSTEPYINMLLCDWSRGISLQYDKENIQSERTSNYRNSIGLFMDTDTRIFFHYFPGTDKHSPVTEWQCVKKSQLCYSINHVRGRNVFFFFMST
jgi:hypothetical protein